MEILPSSPGLSFLSSFLGSIQNECYQSEGWGKKDLTNLVISPIYFLSYDLQNLLLTLIQASLTHLSQKQKHFELYFVGPTTAVTSSHSVCTQLTHSISTHCCHISYEGKSCHQNMLRESLIYFINDEGILKRYYTQ